MKRVQNTHKTNCYDDLHDTLLAIVGAFNRPQRDEIMIKNSGINIDRALFPLLVLIGRFGPIGVGELADRVGRDYTTVSRQVTKLEQMSLTHRQRNVKDKRVNEAIVTPEGKMMTNKIDHARALIYNDIFNSWPDNDRVEFERLLNKFVHDFNALEPIKSV